MKSSSSREVTETDDGDCIVGRGGAVLGGGGRRGPGLSRCCPPTAPNPAMPSPTSCGKFLTHTTCLILM
jgi:hypothetical protein